jgi:hypothetical protein
LEPMGECCVGIGSNHDNALNFTRGCGSMSILKFSMRSLILAAVIILPSCSDDYVVELGVIDIDGVPIAIDIPTSASVGEQIVAVIVTHGDGCVALDRTDVDARSDGADVFPLDRRYVSDNPCPLISNNIEHTVALTFHTPGPKAIRVHGRRRDGLEYEDIQIPVSVVVE